MSCLVEEHEIAVRPGTVEVDGNVGWAAEVVAAVDENSRGAVQAVHL
ncbi:MAG TPA: hypothetical protein VIM19_07320 [Actinomycetes bacterium]